jgi:D,D-heptose 1,7-bisphosphate phosphatase
MNERLNALLLAGGYGTRLRPLTDWMPKCLVTVAGRAVLDYWVEQLETAGVRHARINTHAHPLHVRAYLREVNARPGNLRIDESYEPTLLGSAGTVTANADLADDADDVLVVYTDNFTGADLRELLAFHRSHDDAVTMLLYHSPTPQACGIATLDGLGRIVSFVEKPRNPRSDIANGGVYVVRADAYREMARAGAFDLGHDVMPRFVGRMRGWVWGGYHRDVGTRPALDQTRRYAVTRAGVGWPPKPCRRPAVFLDRDGTLIEDIPYLTRPDQVRVLPGVGRALVRLREAGLASVVVTNQSAVGRGLLSEDGLKAVHEEMVRQLAADGAVLDGIYHCPVVPSADDRTVVEHRDRKPGPGMLLRAAGDLELDVLRSWMVGDMVSDALAGVNARCCGNILVGTRAEAWDGAAAAGVLRLPDLATAAEVILAEDGSALESGCEALAN